MARRAEMIVFSHWYHLLEGVKASPMDFYASVDKAVAQRVVPDSKCSRVDWREGGLLSAKREYLRIRRKEFIFDICGAPFGDAFFVSWWLGEVPSGLLALLGSIPILGAFFRLFIRPITYYRIDTALMFQEGVHAAVMEVIDQLMTSGGLRTLNEWERKPILKQLIAQRAAA